MVDLPADVEFTDRGTGPAILFLPGSFGTGAGWKAVIDRLGDRYRLVTTSLLGYGTTAERRPPGNVTMLQQSCVIDLILDRISAPTHIVGHSFGGFAALAHTIEGRTRPISLTLVEANPFPLLRSADEADLYATFGAMTRVYFAEFERGLSDAARHVVDFYAGPGAFAALPPKVRDYIVKTTSSNIIDWSSADAFEQPLSKYRSIDVPTLVLRGSNGHPAMLRIAEILADTLPRASLHTIEGGSHFLPASHPAEIARLLEAHITATAA